MYLNRFRWILQFRMLRGLLRYPVNPELPHSKNRIRVLHLDSVWRDFPPSTLSLSFREQKLESDKGSFRMKTETGLFMLIFCSVFVISISFCLGGGLPSWSCFELFRNANIFRSSNTVFIFEPKKTFQMFNIMYDNLILLVFQLSWFNKLCYN